MTSDLARAFLAIVDLDRAADMNSANRSRLRTATEEVAAALLARLRVGASVQVGEATYRVEQVTWSSEQAPDGTREPDPHGVPALIRDDHVLGAGARRRGTVRLKQLTAPLARVPRPGEPIAWDLHPATDATRARFAAEHLAVLEGFGLTLRAEAEGLDEAARALLASLVDLLATP
jgi:hypothetical protein